MAQARVTGTFSDTGNSDVIVGNTIFIDLTFAGTATVNIQWTIDGTNWRTVESKTASYQGAFAAGGNPVRLNCSAHTDNVTYAMSARNLF